MTQATRAPGSGDSRSRSASAKQLWFTALAPSGAWAVHLMLGYAITSIGCRSQIPFTAAYLHLLTLLSVAVIVWAGWIGYGAWRESGVGQDDATNGVAGRDAFIGLCGLFQSVLFTALVVVGDFGTFVLSPCP